MAAAIRYELGPVLGSAIPVVLFTVPITLAALYGGFGPGICATLLGALISNFLFIEPIYSLGLKTVSGTVVLGSFLLVGSLISYFGHRMQRMQANLAEQARQLMAANLALEAGAARKDEFLAMLAHELRNPLAGIGTAAELLKVAAGNPQRITQAGAVITRQVGHMCKLVDDLLDVSRVTRGLVALERHPVDVDEVIHGAVEQIRASFDQKQQRLSIVHPESAVWVSGDRIRLIQVIGNLLANANKYSPAGSAVELAVHSAHDSITITVSDQGQGIAAALLPNVFDLFMQAERTPDRAQGGLGIGLALVRKIVELHGGEVAAHSAGEGQGTSMTVRLARIASPAPAP